MYILRFVFLIVISLSCRAADLEHSKAWEQRALVLAVPVDAQAIGDSQTNPGMNWNQGFRVKLRDIAAIHGEVSMKSAEVVLSATEREVIFAHKPIFLFVSTDGAHRIQSVLYWGNLDSIACVPKNILDRMDEGADFSSYGSRQDAKCINAEWFR